MKTACPFIFAALFSLTISESPAQSYPSWDNSPNLNLTSTPGTPNYLGGTVPGSQIAAGYQSNLYYLGFAGGESGNFGVWRWNRPTGWSNVGYFNTYSSSSGGDAPNCLTIQGHYLYVGGSFSGINTDNGSFVTSHNIVKYDFNNGQWSAVGDDSLPLDSVSAMTVDNAGDIYVGASVSLYSGGLFPYWDPQGIYRWNGATWANIGADAEPAGLQPGDTFGWFENIIMGLATDGTNIFAIGGFDGAWLTNGAFIPSHGIIKWDGTNWIQMGANLQGITSGSYQYTGIIYQNQLNEPLDDPWSVAITGTNLFVVGSFGYPQPLIARYSTVSGNYLSCDTLSLNGSTPPSYFGIPDYHNLLGLTAHDNKIYLVGSFDHIGSVAAMSIASWTNDGTASGKWANLGTGVSINNIADSRFVAADDNAVFVAGGSFDSAGSLPIPNVPSVARWVTAPDTPGVDSNFNPSTDGWIDCVALQPDGKILIGGNFSHVDGQNCLNVARLNPDGTYDASFSASDVIAQVGGGEVFAVAVDSNTNVYVAPDPGYCFRLHSDGGLDASFPVYQFMGLNEAVNSIHINGSQSYSDIDICGSFDQFSDGGGSTCGGGPMSALADVFVNGQPDCAYASASGGYARLFGLLYTAANGAIIYGDFTAANGQPATNIALVNGPITPALNLGANSSVFSAAIQSDGKILAGGDFTSLGYDPQNSHLYLGRFNSDGSVDESFGNPNLNDDVDSILVEPNGKILIGGSSDMVNSGGLAQFNSDGSLDNAFNIGVNGYVDSMVRQSDGRVVVVGSFSQVGGETHQNIARIYPGN